MNQNMKLAGGLEVGILISAVGQAFAHDDWIKNLTLLHAMQWQS